MLHKSLLRLLITACITSFKMSVIFETILYTINYFDFREIPKCILIQYRTRSVPHVSEHSLRQELFILFFVLLTYRLLLE